MAEEVEKTTPVQAAEPPKVNPLTAKPKAPIAPTIRKPTLGAGNALRPGLKLPPKPGLATGGLKLPPKPGATIIAKPLIRKPGATVVAKPLPKPIQKPVVPVDAQGVGKLPTVEAKPVERAEAAASVETPKPLETLKTVTQKLKGVTQAIPQQAILHKTGIIAETAAQTEAQKEAAKHKTARISLSDAMGVAPVKSTAAPMKTIRIKRPMNLPGTSSTLKPEPRPATTAEGASAPASTAAEPSLTQRKTLKIARPGATIRPTGAKFTIKKPGATSVPPPQAGTEQPAAPASGEVADIPDIPDMPPTAPVPTAAKEAPAGVGTIIAIVVKLAATIAMGALVWYLYENAQLPTFCGGLGWGA